jgi:hypothetical protein
LGGNEVTLFSTRPIAFNAGLLAVRDLEKPLGFASKSGLETGSMSRD